MNWLVPNESREPRDQSIDFVGDLNKWGYVRSDSVNSLATYLLCKSFFVADE